MKIKDTQIKIKNIKVAVVAISSVSYGKGGRVEIYVKEAQSDINVRNF